MFNLVLYDWRCVKTIDIFHFEKNDTGNWYYVSLFQTGSNNDPLVNVLVMNQCDNQFVNFHVFSSCALFAMNSLLLPVCNSTFLFVKS